MPVKPMEEYSGSTYAQLGVLDGLQILGKLSIIYTVSQHKAHTLSRLKDLYM